MSEMMMGKHAKPVCGGWLWRGLYMVAIQEGGVVVVAVYLDGTVWWPLSWIAMLKIKR
jgi:hypothetical protein